MNIEELKIQIENNELTDNLLIFKCLENTFLAEQYINEICLLHSCGVKNIESLAAESSSALSLVFDLDTDLRVLKVDEFNESVPDFDAIKNTIIVCSKIDKKLEKQLQEFIVEMPKLERWQVVAYAQLICPGISDTSYEWLYDACAGNIYKIINELDKINIFDLQDRQAIFDKIKADENSDLFNLKLFDLSDAVSKHDLLVTHNHMARLNYLNYDPIAFANILLKKYRDLAYVRSHVDPTKLGIKSGKVYYINKDMGTCTNKDLFEKLDFLSSIDSRLKENRLSADPTTLLSYIINKVLEVKN